MDREMDCAKLNSRADDALCEKTCKKQRDCLRHKCGQKCCILFEHPCPLVCGRLLSCGLHRCSEPCHRGNCSSCPNVSFDELSCFCGVQIIYPPIPCGIKPPACDNICSRAHPCSHKGMHPCNKICHAGECDDSNCTQPCKEPRLNCGHPCNAPCHDGQCPNTPCMEKIKMKCSCGNLTSTVICSR